MCRAVFLLGYGTQSATNTRAGNPGSDIEFSLRFEGGQGKKKNCGTLKWEIATNIDTEWNM